MRKFITEEFRQRLHLYFVNGLEIKPLCAAGYDKWLLLILFFNFYQELFLSILVRFGLQSIVKIGIFLDVLFVCSTYFHFFIILLSRAVFETLILPTWIEWFLSDFSLSLISGAIDLTSLVGVLFNRVLLWGLDDHIIIFFIGSFFIAAWRHRVLKSLCCNLRLLLCSLDPLVWILDRVVLDGLIYLLGVGVGKRV